MSVGDSENPFQAPQSIGRSDEAGSEVDPRQIGLARQTPIVAVLMMMNGGLLVIYSLYLFGLAFTLSDKIVAQVGNQPDNPALKHLTPHTFGLILQAVFIALGGLTAASGTLGLWAGALNFSHRGRTLGIVALVSGLVSVVTCWCFPSSLALLIYGLIIYLSHDAERAFRWREANPTT